MQEIELKLTLPTADPAGLLHRLSAIPVLAQSDAAGMRSAKLHNIYFDTPDHRLHRQRIALRLREKSGSSQPQWLQTLKIGASTESALSQRGEWEFALKDAALSYALLQQTPWAALDPDGTLFASLKPCFTTEFERTVWQVLWDDGSRVEVAFDKGQVLAADNSSPLCELELELVSGQARALFDVAALLAHSVAVLPATVSKAQRGFALAQNQTNSLYAPCRKREHLEPALAHKTVRQSFGKLTTGLNALLLSESLGLMSQVQRDIRHFRATVKYFRQWLKEPVPSLHAVELLAQELRNANLHPTKDERSKIIEILQKPATGSELLKISRWLELDF